MTHTRTSRSVFEVLFITVFALLLLVPSIAAADTVFRYGSEISVASDQSIDGDFYAFAGQWWMPGETNMSGTVAEDMYTFGDSVTINGTVGKDIAAAGFDIQVHGPVGDDVRAIGGKIVIGQEVKGDVFVVGEKLTILSSAKIDGNIYFYGSEADIAGDVAGSIHGYAKDWRIDSMIGEGVDITAAGQLTLGARANVVGDVHYESRTDLARATQSVVEGEVTRQDMPVVQNEQPVRTPILFVFAVVFASFFVYLLMRDEYGSFVRSIQVHYARNFVIGLLAFVVTPFVALFLIVTILGSILGFGILFLYLFMLMVAFVTLPILLGLIVRRFYDKKQKVDFLTIIIGAFVLLFCAFIPVLGPLVILVSVLLTIGALSHRIFERLR